MAIVRLAFQITAGLAGEERENALILEDRIKGIAQPDEFSLLSEEHIALDMALTIHGLSQPS